MLRFLRKNPALNYIFPPYHSLKRSISDTNTKSNKEMNTYNLNEAYSSGKSIDIDEMQIDKLYRSL
jgi:hypothetical protein